MRRPLIANRARALRKAMTDPEVMLWSRLRGRSADQPTFRRQHPFGSLIFDFYCPSAGLAVEIDGATHWDDAARARDEARDRWLAGQGVEVLRIPASAVFRDLSGVVDAVLLRACELRATRASAPRPAPSTARSPLRSAAGPPPAASRGR